MPGKLMRFQIGKNGITDGIIGSLNNAFKKHKVIRISLLKSTGRDRNEKKKMAEELCGRLEGSYKYTIVGFTLVMRRVAKTKKKG